MLSHYPVMLILLCMSYYHQPPDLFRIARSLRTQQTQAEVLFWERVRGHRLAGLKFRRQHVLLGKIVDFYCHQAKLIVEIDGEVHSTEQQTIADQHRDSMFMHRGYVVMRISNNDVIMRLDAVCTRVAAAAVARIK